MATNQKPQDEKVGYKARLTLWLQLTSRFLLQYSSGSTLIQAANNEKGWWVSVPGAKGQSIERA